MEIPIGIEYTCSQRKFEQEFGHQRACLHRPFLSCNACHRLWSDLLQICVEFQVKCLKSFDFFTISSHQNSTNLKKMYKQKKMKQISMIFLFILVRGCQGKVKICVIVKCRPPGSCSIDLLGEMHDR